MIRVGIVDDHAVVRAGLKQFLGEQVDLRVTGEAADGADALDLVRGGELDVLVMDLSMPDQSGVDALAAIKARARAAGADPQRLSRDALRDHPAAAGRERLPEQGMRSDGDRQGDPHGRPRPPLHHAGGGRAAGRPAHRDGDRPAHEQLSEREFQVFLHLAKGETVGQWPRAMCLSVKTVSTYRTRVMEKMKLTSNSDLTYYALKNGLIQ